MEVVHLHIFVGLGVLVIAVRIHGIFADHLLLLFALRLLKLFQMDLARDRTFRNITRPVET